VLPSYEISSTYIIGTIRFYTDDRLRDTVSVLKTVIADMTVLRDKYRVELWINTMAEIKYAALCRPKLRPLLCIGVQFGLSWTAQAQLKCP
jgi:hypothetical protein